MKGLPKSLRDRQRYVWFHVETDPWVDVAEKDVQRGVWWEAQNLYGDLVSSRADLRLVEWDGGVGALRVKHDRVREARAALACVHEVGGAPVGTRVLGVSGTLKSGRREYQDTVETEELVVDGVKAWRRGERIDVVPGKQNKYSGGRPTGTTVYDVGSGDGEPGLE